LPRAWAYSSQWARTCLRLVATPFTALEPWPSAAAPVGAVLLADVRAGIAPLAQALRAHRTASWCPVCLLVDGSIAPEEFCFFEPWPDCFAWVVAPPKADWPPPAVVLNAVRSRPRPERSHLAAYVAFRTGVPELETLLKAHLFASEGSAHPSRRTVARHFMELGSLLPHEWSRLSELAGWILESRDCAGSLERKAAHAGIDQRTLRRWLDRLLGVSIAQALETPGWEWMFELALRRFGYIEGIAGSIEPLGPERVG